MTPPTTPGYYYVISELDGDVQIMELIDNEDGTPLHWKQIGDGDDRDDVATGERWRFAPVPPYTGELLSGSNLLAKYGITPTWRDPFAPWENRK